MALVRLPVVKGHLRLSQEADAATDADVTLCLTAASEAIVSYLKSRANAAWTEDTVPAPVQRAILLLCAHYYEHRGDDPQTDALLWDSIGRLLAQFRDPALA